MEIRVFPWVGGWYDLFPVTGNKVFLGGGSGGGVGRCSQPLGNLDSGMCEVSVFSQ